MQNILITGATGGLGGDVATFLKEKKSNQKISVLVRDANSERAKELANQGFELRVADYNDKNSLLKAFEGVDLLYFVSSSDIQNRLSQHIHVVEAATESKVGHVFYTSVSLNNLSTEAPLYGAMSAHLETEKRIAESGLTYTFLRHNLYSEVIPMFLGTKEQLLGSKAVYLPTGSGKTAFVARNELAEAGASVLANPENHQNKTYEMNGSEKVTFEQIAEFLTEITGESIAYVSPGIKEFEETLTQHGVPAEYIDLMTIFGLGIADGAFDSPASDLENLLGRKSLPVADFLKKIY